MKLHVSDSSSVHHQEVFTVHTAVIYAIQVYWQLVRKLSANLYVLLCVQWKTPGGGQRNCPKHVEFYFKNKFEKLVHLFGFIIRNLETNITVLKFRQSTLGLARCYMSKYVIYEVFNLKVDRILIWVIYLLIFTTCYITQLTFIYSKCWKWCPFTSVHLSTRFTMFLATFLAFFHLLLRWHE